MPFVDRCREDHGRSRSARARHPTPRRRQPPAPPQPGRRSHPGTHRLECVDDDDTCSAATPSFVTLPQSPSVIVGDRQLPSLTKVTPRHVGASSASSSLLSVVPSGPAPDLATKGRPTRRIVCVTRRRSAVAVAVSAEEVRSIALIVETSQQALRRIAYAAARRSASLLLLLRR